MVVQVQPEYYGLLLFAEAGAGALVSTSVATAAQNFTGWAIKANAGYVSVVLNNRNASTAVSATVNLGAAVSAASAIYLQPTPAGSLTAGPGSVTLAGPQVSAAGEWRRNPPYSQIGFWKQRFSVRPAGERSACSRCAIGAPAACWITLGR